MSSEINTNANGNSRIYGPEKAAEILEVKVSFVKRLLREGILKGFKMDKFWRTTEDALNGYITVCRDKSNGKKTVDVGTRNKIRFHASIRSQESLWIQRSILYRLQGLEKVHMHSLWLQY